MSAQKWFAEGKLVELFRRRGNNVANNVNAALECGSWHLLDKGDLAGKPAEVAVFGHKWTWHEPEYSCMCCGGKTCVPSLKLSSAFTEWLLHERKMKKQITKSSPRVWGGSYCLRNHTFATTNAWQYVQSVFWMRCTSVSYCWYCVSELCHMSEPLSSIRHLCIYVHAGSTVGSQSFNIINWWLIYYLCIFL